MVAESGNQPIIWTNNDYIECALERFFKEQEGKPPSLRQTGAYLVCFCEKCKRQRGTL